jgi:hypothetical protein
MASNSAWQSHATTLTSAIGRATFAEVALTIARHDIGGARQCQVRPGQPRSRRKAGGASGRGHDAARRLAGRSLLDAVEAKNRAFVSRAR